MSSNKTTNINNFNPEPFNPVMWLRNPHLQTILPKFFAKKAPKYRRVVYKDSFSRDEVAYDFYDAINHDNLNEKSDQPNEKITTPLVVLFHGLEGSSSSHYAITLAHQIHALGWHYVVPHYRSCGGMPFYGDIVYNAGDTVEAHHVLGKLYEKYTTIYAIGVSLGGNILAKYMGEYQDQALCRSAVVVSAPLDLASSTITMNKFMGKYIYTPYLLNPLVKKALTTHLSKVDYEALNNCKSLYEFDHIFTAPRHGFRSANDYCQQSSSLPLLRHISKPTLIISAKDDPFLGVTARETDVSDSVTIIRPNCGGHIGFLRYLSKEEVAKNLNAQTINTSNKTGHFNLTWVADTALDFFQSI